jgi:hypothetical protein
VVESVTFKPAATLVPFTKTCSSATRSALPALSTRTWRVGKASSRVPAGTRTWSHDASSVNAATGSRLAAVSSAVTPKSIRGVLMSLMTKSCCTTASWLDTLIENLWWLPATADAQRVCPQPLTHVCATAAVLPVSAAGCPGPTRRDAATPDTCVTDSTPFCSSFRR